MTELSKEQLDKLKAQQEYIKILADLKKKLKPYSKSQIIAIVLDQANRFHQMQEVNKVLLQENEELKSKLNIE